MKKLLYLTFICFHLLSFCRVHSTEFDERKEKISEYLSTLVAFNTTTGNYEGNTQALAWVETQLAPLKLFVRSYEFNGYRSLMITTQETMKPNVMMVAHIDVVAAPEALFHPVIKNNKMFGRGVYDMKMAIACYIQLMNELKDTLKDYSIGIMLTSDEEIGGMNGVKALLKEGYLADVAFLPDGGFNWNFEEKAKGVLHVKVVSKGKSAHSSRPWLGENAINQLMDVLQEIQKDFERQKSVDSDFYPTANIGVIHGGTVINQIPDYADALIDIRFPPSSSAVGIYRDLERIVNQHPKVFLECIAEGSPHQENLDSGYFQRFRQLAKQLHGIEVGSTSSHGSSDARFFGEKGIPVLVIAPQGGDIHADNEWIDLDDMTRFYDIMKGWVMTEGIVKKLPPE